MFDLNKFVQSFFYKLALRIYSEIYLISSIGYIYIYVGERFQMEKKSYIKCLKKIKVSY